MAQNSNIIPLTVRLKRRKITVVLLISAKETLQDMKIMLADYLNEAEANKHKNSSDNKYDDLYNDIEIPIPRFDTQINATKQYEETEKSDEGEEMQIDSTDKNNEKIVAEDIRLALPVNKADLGKGWKEISEKSTNSIGIQDAGIRDLSTLAFAIGSDEPFEVELPLPPPDE